MGREVLVMAPLTSLASHCVGLHSVCNAATCCKEQATDFWLKRFLAKHSTIILVGNYKGKGKKKKRKDNLILKKIRHLNLDEMEDQSRQEIAFLWDSLGVARCR